MIEARSDYTSPVMPRQAVAFSIDPKDLDANWAAIEGVLRSTPWAAVVSVDEIRASILDGRMQLWSALDPGAAPGGQLLLALTQIRSEDRSRLCALWLVALAQSDQASIDILLDACESFARQHECQLLRITAFPSVADRIDGTITQRSERAVTIERDLRQPRSAH